MIAGKPSGSHIYQDQDYRRCFL